MIRIQLLVFLLISQICFSQSFENPLTDFDKSFVKDHNIKSISGYDSIGIHFLKEFDEQGNLIKTIFNNLGSIPDIEINYQYQDELLVVRREEYITTQYYYDDKGCLIKEVSSSDNRRQAILKYVVDKNCKIKKEIYFGFIRFDNGPTFKRKYKYNSRDNITEIQQKFEPAQVEKTIYTYDKLGLLIRKEVSEDTKSINTYEYSYDDEQNRTELRLYNPQLDRPSIELAIYDYQNKIVRWERYGTEEHPYTIYEYEYLSSGLLANYAERNNLDEEKSISLLLEYDFWE
jgi:hypothetical protein